MTLVWRYRWLLLGSLVLGLTFGLVQWAHMDAEWSETLVAANGGLGPVFAPRAYGGPILIDVPGREQFRIVSTVGTAVFWALVPLIVVWWGTIHEEKNDLEGVRGDPGDPASNEMYPSSRIPPRD